MIFSTVCITEPSKADESLDLTHLDQQAHAAVSYGIALTATRLFETHDFTRPKSILYASVITLAIGAAKEFLIDKQASSGDLAADTIGAAGSALVVWSFEL